MPSPSTHWAMYGLRAARAFLPGRYAVVHGFYGMGNVGDEAILDATVGSIRAHTTLEPLVFAWDPARVAARHGVRSLDPRRDVPAAYRALVQAGAFLLGGGGLIKDFGGGSESLLRWMHWIDKARRLGVPTMTWSVGVDEVTHPESARRVREVLAEVDAVTVRDEASARRLTAMGVTRDIAVTADPVVDLARRARQARRGGGRLRVVAAPRHLFAEAEAVTRPAVFEALLDAFAEALDHLQAAHGAEVTFVPFRTRDMDDDREVCRRILGRMRHRDRADILDTEDPSVDGVLRRLAGADLQIGMRLHAAVMAASLGVPSVAVAYLPKVSAFMAEVGQSTFCTEADAASGAWMIDRAETALADRDRLGDTLREQTDRLAEAYARNGTLLARLVA